MEGNYTIISAGSLDDLVGAVNNAKSDGWEPLGAPFVIPGKDRIEVTSESGKQFKTVFAQALVKRPGRTAP